MPDGKLVPPEVSSGAAAEAVLYFPGCGGALFYDRIAQASISLLLKAGFTVVVPPRHLCCGYPLLAAGAESLYQRNRETNLTVFRALREETDTAGLRIKYLLTACGTCRDSLERHEPRLEEIFPGIIRQDAMQLALDRLKPASACGGAKSDEVSAPTLAYDGRGFTYHTACHMEWAGLSAATGHARIAAALETATGASLRLSTGCCGESGMGAFTNPAIYSTLRARKCLDLRPDKDAYSNETVLVGCPSCKLGIGRALLSIKDKRGVLHIAEWLAQAHFGEDWRQRMRRAVNEARGPVRMVAIP